MHRRLPPLFFAAITARTLLLCPASSCDSETCDEQSLHGVPEASWSLVQSRRSIESVSSGLAHSTHSESSNDAEQPPRQHGQGIDLSGVHIAALTRYTWARFARFISEQWRVIILMFTLAFCCLFPGMHWAIEDRESERNIFAATFSESSGSPSASATEDPNRAYSGYSNEPGEGILKLLEHIRVDDQGGLDNCRQLMPESGARKWKRVCMLMLKITAVVFNVTMMCVMNRAMLLGAMQFYNGESEADLPTTLRKYLRLTSNVSLISVRHAACVALAELIGLSAMLSWICYRFIVFIHFRRSPDVRLKFDAFLAVYEVFDGITVLGSFSALRLVSLSHPILILTRFQFHMVTYASSGGVINQAFQATWFITTRILVVLIGIIAFGVKLAFASVSMHSPMSDGGPWLTHLMWRWSVVVITLVQTLGAVSIERVLWNRVMFFIIAGGDGIITLPKVQTAHVYLSRLMQAIYEEFCGKSEVFKYFLVMMTFDHADLQFMLLDEDEGGADELVRKATVYFEKHHRTIEGLDSSESPATFKLQRSS